MSQFLAPQIVFLKDGTDTSQGLGQLVSNMNACQVIVEILRTTLGPRGLDKLIDEGSGKVTISNDGATIMKLLNIVHPAARTLVDIAKSQDAEVGDGTTSVALLAGEMLKNCKDYVQDGLHPRTIIRAYRKASDLAIEHLREIAVDIHGKDAKDTRRLLQRCASTSLNSKLIAHHKEFFSSIVTDAVLSLDEDLDLSMIGIKKVRGGSTTDSQLVKGVAFKKTFSYAGFEQQPKEFTNPKVIMLNIELELKSEKENAEVRDMNRVSRAVGGVVQTTMNSVAESDYDTILGTCDRFEEVQIGNERYNMFTGCAKAKTATIIVRGGSEQFMAETERSLHDSIMIARRTIKHATAVAGGGAVEMELSRHLREFAMKVHGKEQLILLAFAKSLEVIPRTLCDNAGFDSTDVLNKLRAKHATADGKWYGVDIEEAGICNTWESFVWEPAVVKINAIGAASEAACMILSVDETVENPKSEAQAGGGGGGGVRKFKGRGGR
ncbi:unnamed protein product [Chondrus crispus]|uniref:T-complex protein 1 subunit eta n=1 Tax=Chondrus crispus TaxID=2769 RepID=R7QJE2_CHOCR|nr:unnamed protein product [Chondrus crispus]CDF37510.1 unnamed protein product [Chondrus crispus]|eukprot:XP_005717381.1 unnamed protein product [Chondrus crispus]